MSDAEKKIRVFVHLAHGFGAATWNRKFVQGELIGVNEPYAYGYQHANEMGCAVTYSEDFPYTPIEQVVRLGLRALLGFDLFHAYKNRDGIFGADVVWTHTESQFLAILLLARFERRALPKMICQSVWLVDAFPRRPWPLRVLYRKLIKRADILTFHSPLNAAKAKQLFRGAKVEVVKYGINCSAIIKKPFPASKAKLVVITVGNDRHRDWECLIEGLGNGGHDVVIVSRTIGKTSARKNIRIETPSTNDDLKKLYADADVAIVPLKANNHVSGLTAIFEALVFSKPTICTDSGGLRSYFSDEQVYFTELGKPEALREAVDAVLADPALANRKLAAAQLMLTEEVNSRTFVKSHVEISRRLLNLPAETANPAAQVQ